MADSQPNIVFIMTDQHRADHVGFGGNAVVDTPHLDAIAARGMVFDRAFVANPICMPNRATIMTGRMPSAHGTRYNGVPLDWGANTFVRCLRLAGYDTIHVGKSHLQNMGVSRRYMARHVDTDAAGATTHTYPEGWDTCEDIMAYRTRDEVALPEDYYGFGHVDFTISHSDVCGGHYYQWLLGQGIDPTQWQGMQNALEVYPGWHQVYQTRLPEALYPSRYIADRAIEQIERVGGESDRPFFLHCSFPDPHHPFSPPGRYWQQYAPGDMPLPETFNADHAASMPHISRLIQQRGVPADYGVDPWAPDPDQFRHALAAQYGMISMIDDQVGRIVGALADQGLDNTIIVFSSDHGDMMGDHGLLLKHFVHYEACLRVPLVIVTPDRAPGRCRSIVSSIDIAQTLLDLAGLPAYHDMQGASLVPLLDNPERHVRDRLLIEEDEKPDALSLIHI